MLECNNADFPCNNFHAIFSLIGDCILCPSNHHSASVFMMYRHKFRTSLVETNHRNCGWVRWAVKNDTTILNLNLTFELYFKQLKMLEFKWFRNGAWVGLTVKSDNLLLNLNSKMWFFETTKHFRIQMIQKLGLGGVGC